MLKIEGQLFQVGKVIVSEGAKDQAAYLQGRQGRKGAEAVSVHCSVLLKLHATGQYGEIPNSDKIINENNIKRGAGRVLSVIGEKHPFVIITDLETGDTSILTPPEV
jgi:hypothetical protein